MFEDAFNRVKNGKKQPLVPKKETRNVMTSRGQKSFRGRKIQPASRSTSNVTSNKTRWWWSECKMYLSFPISFFNNFIALAVWNDKEWIHYGFLCLLTPEQKEKMFEKWWMKLVGERYCPLEFTPCKFKICDQFQHVQKSKQNSGYV